MVAGGVGLSALEAGEVGLSACLGEVGGESSGVNVLSCWAEVGGVGPMFDSVHGGEEGSDDINPSSKLRGLSSTLKSVPFWRKLCRTVNE